MRRSFHRSLRPQILKISADGCNRKRTRAPLVCNRAIPLFQASIDFDQIPIFRVADVLDGDAVLARPKERHGIKTFAMSENVSRGDLSLALGDDPVFDAKRLARMGVRPASNVARGKDPRHACFEVFVDDNAAIRVSSPLARLELERVALPPLRQGNPRRALNRH